tara:strand:+ start:344 stop:559 length:216 start_codon:yes stop_codon:yes gene_type:complete
MNLNAQKSQLTHEFKSNAQTLLSFFKNNLMFSDRCLQRVKAISNEVKHDVVNDDTMKDDEQQQQNDNDLLQ